MKKKKEKKQHMKHHKIIKKQNRDVQKWHKTLGEKKVQIFAIKMENSGGLFPYLTLQLLSVEVEDSTIFPPRSLEKISLQRTEGFFFQSHRSRGRLLKPHSNKSVLIVSKFSLTYLRKYNDSALKQKAVNKAITEVTKKILKKVERKMCMV